jgi:colicin import membrane protein
MIVRPPRGWLALAQCALAGLASAAPPTLNLDQRYPAGSISSQASAERALLDADATQRDIDTRYKEERARCAHVVLVNECQDKARRAHTQGQNAVHRVQVEAHDLQRKLAAQQRAQQRDAQQAQQQRDDAARPEKERAAEQAAQHRADQAEERAQEALKQQTQAPSNREKYDERNTQHDRDVAQRSSVQIRDSPENARRYQEKQDQAKSYAATRAREREQSQRERAERERKRKAQMARDAAEPAPATDPSPAKTPAPPER